MTDVVVSGFADDGFGEVADAFRTNFTEHGDVGAAVCVYRDGVPVVDLWGGVADPATGRPWESDSVQLVFSTTKGATAVCVHSLVEQGVLDVDAPVASYWPEFAANGKGDIPLRWVLSHRAGLAAVEGDLTLEEIFAGTPVVDALAAQAPNWPPGTSHGYHARTFGWILGEVVRRVTGVSIGTWFAEHVAAPLGLDFWIGTPASVLPRAGRMIPPAPPEDPRTAAFMESFFAGDTLTARVMTGPSRRFRYDDMWNDPALLAAEMPSSNGVASARSIARMYAATVGTVDGVRLLAPETVDAACVEQSSGPDCVTLQPLRIGLGFMLPPTIAIGAGPSSFGHSGAGGSLGMADRDAAMAFGYVMNQMVVAAAVDPRASGLVDAVYRALG